MFSRKINDDLALALVQPSFAKDYLRIIAPNQEDFSRFLPWAASKLNEEFFLEYINKSLHGYAEGIMLPCSIIYRGELVGNIDFHQIDRDAKKASIGYWLDPEFRGRGIIGRSVKEFISIGFNELSLNRIEIWTSTKNEKSRSVAERAGFIQETNIREQDKVSYGLVRSVYTK